MKFIKLRNAAVLLLVTLFAAGILFYLPQVADAGESIKIYINSKEIKTDTNPVIINDRTMVPIRVISESLGMNVEWDGTSRRVIITGKQERDTTPIIIEDYYQSISILGDSMVSSDELQRLAWKNNPNAPRLADLYIKIGKEYGIRGDIAFCQAAKETGWWKYGGLVKAYQNNYCGLSATGKAATGNEDLRGSDPTRVWFTEGVHGAIFKTPADGVEAHVQHLYAYVSKSPLPAGKILLDPRFVLVTRGIAQTWSDLDGRWAVPGVGYGQSILNDYYAQAINNSDSDNMVSMTPEEKIAQLEKDKQLLQLEVLRLQRLLDEK